MRLQSQLLSKKRFDEHLDPLPLGAYTTALKELDESGIHASHFTRKLLHGRHFNFNHTLGIGAGISFASGTRQNSHFMWRRAPLASSRSLRANSTSSARLTTGFS